MPLFGGLFKSKDGSKSSKAKNQTAQAPAAAQQYPAWQESWERTTVATDEIHELVHLATQEMKARDLDSPFFLLPFRPDADLSTNSSARNFICRYFKAKYEGSNAYSGTKLSHELLLTEPPVLCSIIKWCWSRLPGGVVTWETYEMFRIGEEDSKMAIHSFDTFIPLSVENEARKQIIFDFFDLLAAISARGKTNGLGGRKLSRLAGWWAFELNDGGKGFDGGYSSWTNAANACSHLFFAYLRSLSPENQPGLSGISPLPRSLQALLSQTEYPPQVPTLMQSTTPKVVMIVDSVSPTPFALLRRTAHFEYRDEDVALQQFSTFDDPVRALTDECRRVLKAISSVNQIDPQQATDSDWSRFQNAGFAQTLDENKASNGSALPAKQDFSGIRSEAGSRQNDFGRPTTPSWADFMTSGFSEDASDNAPAPVLLPPDKQLPPIGEAARVRSSQSHIPNGKTNVEPGELASIGRFELDDTFWWVWITSLAVEETTSRKAVFGRCALIEVEIAGAKWLLVEEQIKGASPRPEKDAYIAEKKSKFSLRNRLGRRKSTGKKVTEPYRRNPADSSQSKTSITPDQHTRIQKAAAQLAQEQQQKAMSGTLSRRGRTDDSVSTKTSSVLTLQPQILSEAAPAMKWAKEFDKDTVRSKYLSNREAGTGKPVDQLSVTRSRDEAAAGVPASAEPAVTSPSSPVSRKAVSSSPIPFPASPAAVASPRGEKEAVQAASVPLPAEKPVASAHEELPDLSQHPAYRTSESAEATQAPAPPKKDLPNAAAAARAAWEKRAEAATPPADSPSKLKKPAPTSGGGFKRMFGRGKNKGEKERSTTPLPPAKDSLSSPTTGLDPARPSNVSAISAVSNNTAQAHELPAEDVSPMVAAPPTAQQSQAADAVANEHQSIHAAAAEPTQFKEGPLEDVPAFAPESPVLPEEKQTAAVPDTRANVVTPVNNNAEAVRADNESEKSLDLEKQNSPQDRWAQIRKNAAERATRVSEEQNQRTDDGGETSGEETIENRVARIKARVAELTGQMEPQGNANTPTR